MHENKKTCKKCGIEKDLDCFTQSKNIKDGYENTCKKCRNDQRKKYINICQSCNKEFKASKKEAKFCNSKCQGLARRNRVFCSRECYMKANQLKPTTKKLQYNCDYCGKEMSLWKSRIEYTPRHYCSIECKNKGWALFYSGENAPAYKNNNYDQLKEFLNK